MRQLLIALCFFTLAQANAFLFNDLKSIPIVYEGRIRPVGNNIQESEWKEHFFTGSRQVEEDNAAIQKLVAQFQQEELSPHEISKSLQEVFPVRERLKNANQHIFALPSKFRSGQWLSLEALKTKMYDPIQEKITLISNFTGYSDALFTRIQTQYLALEYAVKSHKSEKEISALSRSLATSLLEGYEQVRILKRNELPSSLQLQAEVLYIETPFTLIIIGFYVIGALLLCFKPRIGFSFALAGFLIHTLELALRCYILERPPVTNMFETVLYVPWIAMLIALLMRSRWILFAGTISAITLLSILAAIGAGKNLEPVQPVLNSQYWLIIHVLMVVGSYGVFALSAVLAHLLLITSNKSLEKGVLQSLYLGVALLTLGTILGGVWAAQSWGRFWDWDPKEAWAFISICVYLVFIHLYRRGSLRFLGLAFGSIIGFTFISFTWYGVNYLLGTGLHSYGFGSGGVTYYLIYIFGEMAFLTTLGLIHLKRKKTV